MSPDLFFWVAVFALLNLACWRLAALSTETPLVPPFAVLRSVLCQRRPEWAIDSGDEAQEVRLGRASRRRIRCDFGFFQFSAEWPGFFTSHLVTRGWIPASWRFACVVLWGIFRTASGLSVDKCGVGFWFG